MRVAYFIGSLKTGGTEILLLDSFRSKDVSLFDCILIYRNDGDLTEAFRASEIPLFRVKPHGLKLGYIHQLRRILKWEGIDILHTQTLFNAFLGLFCVCFSHIRLVASFHGLFLSFKNRVLTHLVMWLADASVFVSEYVRDWYIQHTFFAPRRRCYVVHNGIDFSKFNHYYPCPDFLEKNTIGHEHCVKLAMVGSFVSGRSQEFICRCLKQLRDNGEERFLFFFIGRRSDAEPRLYDDCVRFCKENGLWDKVFFLGGRSDVPAILQHIDGFVYSTINDTFGIAVVEAMAVGVPVIVNDWEVMKEVSCNGQWATLYRTNDVDDCVSKISDLICHRNNGMLSAANLSNAVRETFSIERHIQNLNSVYNSL